MTKPLCGVLEIIQTPGQLPISWQVCFSQERFSLSLSFTLSFSLTLSTLCFSLSVQEWEHFTLMSLQNNRKHFHFNKALIKSNQSLCYGDGMNYVSFQLFEDRIWRTGLICRFLKSKKIVYILRFLLQWYKPNTRAFMELSIDCWTKYILYTSEVKKGLNLQMIWVRQPPTVQVT